MGTYRKKEDTGRTIRRAITYKLYPTPVQDRDLREVLVTLCHFYNGCLRERKNAYECEKSTIDKFQQKRAIPALRAKSQYLRKCYQNSLQEVVNRLDKAFDAFFRR